LARVTGGYIRSTGKRGDKKEAGQGAQKERLKNEQRRKKANQKSKDDRAQKTRKGNLRFLLNQHIDREEGGGKPR